MKPSESRDHKEFTYFSAAEKEVGEGERDERMKHAARTLLASG